MFVHSLVALAVEDVQKSSRGDEVKASTVSMLIIVLVFNLQYSTATATVSVDTEQE